MYFVCYRKHRNWYGDVLSQCLSLPQDEVAVRASGCVCGGVATAMVLFGAKKQLLLFPEKFEVVHELYRGVKREQQEGGGGGAGQEGGEGEGQGGRGGEGEEGSGRCHKRTDRTSKSVGKVLGNAFGYESSSSESDCSHGSGDSSHMPHPSGGSGDSSHTPSSLHGSDEDHLADSSTHNTHPSDPSVNRETPSLVEQVHAHFGNWCERLADGTLKRYSVEAWPEWPHP